MNIFVLSKNPKLAARYHCDKHVVKMIIEYTQMMSTTHHHFTGISPMKPTHKNHPCTMWVMQSVHNYNRLAQLALDLCGEYTKRYNKVHSLEKTIRQLQKAPKKLPRTEQMTPFVVVMPEHYVHKNPVKAYRDYYLFDKIRFAKRKYSNKPYWMVVEG